MTVIVPDWNGPGSGFTITYALAYLDTVEILVKFPLPAGLMGTLRKLAGRRMHPREATRPDKVDPSTRHAYGMIIRLVQPTNNELQLILALCGDEYRVIRADVACDFHLANAQEAKNCARYLTQHGWQKWRGKTRRRNDTENVAYWSANANTTRNIALYHDKPSRKNGEPCAHWEMKFIGAGACRRAGLDDLRKLLEGIDVLRLMKRQAKLKAFNRKRFFKATETAAANTKRRYDLEKMTVDQVQKRIHGFIFAALQTSRVILTEETIHTVSAQKLHDRAERIQLVRNALVQLTTWEELSPAPRWLR